MLSAHHVYSALPTRTAGTHEFPSDSARCPVNMRKTRSHSPHGERRDGATDRPTDQDPPNQSAIPAAANNRCTCEPEPGVLRVRPFAGNAAGRPKGDGASSSNKLVVGSTLKTAELHKSALSVHFFIQNGNTLHARFSTFEELPTAGLHSDCQVLSLVGIGGGGGTGTGT